MLLLSIDMMIISSKDKPLGSYGHSKTLEDHLQAKVLSNLEGGWEEKDGGRRKREE